MIRHLLVAILSLSIPLADALSTIFIHSPVTTITLPRREVPYASFPAAGLGPPVAATPVTTPTTLKTVAAPGYPASPPTPTTLKTVAAPGYPASPPTPSASVRPKTSKTPESPKPPKVPENPKYPEHPPLPATPATSFPTAPSPNPPPEYEIQPGYESLPPFKTEPRETEPVYRPRGIPKF
ncbi:hypothetical protein EMCG_04785 [[Emmonsia] crescens]|uniref:Uncharacterized protein n=1 Tax=[Emmonsia] crescens TaxID=73230 RepID=A0A0G2HRB5_9EURO|nr:hypothetical protein EMCG_04785 [Emmonsia crescens UAMH 3008]